MNKNDQETISEIFDLLRSGKKSEGVDLLYRIHYMKMYGVAFSVVKNESESQDVVHNVIYNLMRLDVSKFPSSSEVSWLYRVVKNEALMFLRNKKTIISIDEIVSPIIEDQDIHDFIDMDKYYSMIKGLNEEQRQIVTLKVLGGYTHKEISEMLGKPIGTIQWIYNTSVKKLKITLTSIILVMMFVGYGLIARIMNYIKALQSTPEVPDQMINIPFDHMITVLGLILITGFVVFTIIYKYSDRISLKADKK